MMFLMCSLLRLLLLQASLVVASSRTSAYRCSESHSSFASLGFCGKMGYVVGIPESDSPFVNFWGAAPNSQMIVVTIDPNLIIQISFPYDIFFWSGRRFNPPAASHNLPFHFLSRFFSFFDNHQLPFFRNDQLSLFFFGIRQNQPSLFYLNQPSNSFLSFRINIS